MRIITAVLGFSLGLVFWAMICQVTYGSPPPIETPLMSLVMILGLVIAVQMMVIVLLLDHPHPPIATKPDAS